MRKAAFAIILALGLTSLFGGLSFVGTAYNRLAPAWHFGAQAAEEQHIRVIENGRHYLRFSNDPSSSVPKSELKGLNAMCIAARFIVVVGFFYGLVFVTVQVLNRLDSKLAAEVLKIARFRHG